MTEESTLNISSDIIDADVVCTLDELCRACNVEADWIAELVEHGIIEPVGQARSDWRFAMVTVVRVAKAKRLERDLALNLPGLALALDLLDEIDDLRSKLKLNQQPK
jgi:chaperone modulatory protein CbpM